MLGLVIVAGGVIVGVFSRRFALPFAAIARAQMVMVMPLAVLAGWSADLSSSSLAAVAVLVCAEAVAIALAYRVLRGEGRQAYGLATAAAMNTAAWSYPVATAISPAATAFIVLVDQGTAPFRGSALVGLLRRGAPAAQPKASKLTDYAPQAGLTAGLCLHFAGVPAPAWSGAGFTVLALALSALTYVLIAHAWPKGPLRIPTRALTVTAVRFVVVPGALGVAALAGVAVPAGAWVLALSCSWFAFLSFCRMYGYRTDMAAAVIALSGACALAALPVLLLLT